MISDTVSQRIVETVHDMENYGEQLAGKLKPNTIVYLNGNLGAGKTTLVRGILRGKKYIGAVPSPTFTLVETYSLGNEMLLHVDLYRLEHPDELDQLAIRDYLEDSCILIVEWAEKAKTLLPKPDCEIEIEISDAESRIVHTRCLTQSGLSLCAD